MNAFIKSTPAAGVLQHILIIAGIRHVLEAKSRSLVDHVDHQLVFVQLEGHVDFSLAALLVAVLKGVHHAFVDREANLVLIVLAESGSRGDTHAHFFGESDALDQRLQYDFNPLRF